MDWEGETYLVRLPPGPGRREHRYAQRLTGDVVDVAPGDSAENKPPPIAYTPVQDRIATLEEDLASLRAEVASLHEALETFRKQFE